MKFGSLTLPVQADLKSMQKAVGPMQIVQEVRVDGKTQKSKSKVKLDVC